MPSPEVEAAMREALEAAEAKPPRAKEGPRVAPSAELEAAMRAALEAETAATPPSAPPKPRPAPRPRPASDEGPKITPSPELEAVLRQALEAESAPRPAETAPGKGPARPPGRGALPKLDVGDTVKEALRQQKLMMQGGGQQEAVVKRPTNAAAWIVIALLSVGAAAGGVWYMSGVEEPPEPVVPHASVPSGARPAASSVSVDQAVQALREVQSAIGPNLSLVGYQAKVAAAQTALGPFVETGVPLEARPIVRETLDIYVLAGAAWQARTADSREVWESIGRSPALELCPGVKQVADAAGQGQARGRAVSSAIGTLWDCAERRIARLDRLRVAR
jgi:hypothetical protein